MKPRIPIALGAALASSACGREAASPAAEAVAGKQLYEQVSHSYPAHDLYELDHQLVVRSEDPARVMELLALRPGMVVADLGCGSGFYTTRLAEAVGPAGVVHAIDIQPIAIEYLGERLRRPENAGLADVRLALSAVDDCRIPAETLDAALFTHADFYAYETLLPENRAMLASVARALKVGGALVVVQDVTITPYASLAAMVRNFEESGLTREVAELRSGSENAYLRFRKGRASPR
jgi:ubiquinone/menaquinone biosynthesis C-methylase UbiE